MTRAARLTGLIALTLIGTALAGEAAGIEWQVTAGFGGASGASSRYTRDAWTPLRVTLQNRGSSQTGRIVIPVPRDSYSEPTLYAVSVDLPKDARKTYHLLVPRVDHGMIVRLTTASGTDGKELQGSNSVAPSDLLMVVLSSSDGILGFLNGTPAPAIGRSPGGSEPPRAPGSASTGSEFAIAHSAWGLLPRSWLGWDGADVVVVADSELGDAEEAELEALRLWVRLGGALVITGGTRAPALGQGPLGDILPMDVAGTKAVEDLGALEGWGHEPIPRQAALIADGTLREGAEVLLGSEQTPLAVRRALGAGTVVMTTFDFTAEPVRYWDGQPRMWARLVGAGMVAQSRESILARSSSPNPYAASRRTGNLAAAAGHTEEAALPPLWLVVGFLVAYIIILVPVNYWFVSRMQRRELAWLTTPAIILVFFGAAYGTGFALRGHQTLLNRVAVIEADADQGVARATGFAGIFSPAKMDYAMRLEDTAAAAVSTDTGGTDRFTVQFGPEPTVENIAVNMWSTRVIEVPFVADIGEGLSGYLEWDGSNVSGVVRNNTGLRLESVAIVRGKQIGDAKPLASGQESRLDMAVAIDLSGHTPPPDETLGERAIRQIFAEDSHYGGPSPVTSRVRNQAWVVAVTDEPLMPVELVGRRARVEDASLIVARLPVRLKPGPNVHVPDWLIEARIVDTTGTARTYEDYEGQHISIAQGGSMTWEFVVPVGPEGGIAQTLQLQTNFDYSPGMSPGPGPGPTVGPGNMAFEAFNVRIGQWESVNMTGSSISEAAKYMTQDGVVRLRISAPSTEVRLRSVGMSGTVSAR